MQEPATGRDGEIARAGAFLANEARATPATVLIEGAPGIGKSWVWNAVVDRAAAHARILVARPSEPETAVSFAAVGDLLGGITDDDLAGLPDPQQRALKVACLREEPLQAVEDLRVIGTALASLLRRLADRSAVIVAIDDAQWLDIPSRRALAFALRRVRSARLGILLTIRSGSMTGLPLGLEELGPGHVHRLVLGPLGSPDLRRIVVERLSLDLTPTQARRLHELSGGNPLLAIEIARTVARSADEAELWRRLAALADVSSLIGERIRALPPRARLALAAAAALAEPRMDTLAQLFGSADTAAAEIAHAVPTGIVTIDQGRIRFHHPLFAAAAYGSLSDPEQRALQADLASVVKDPEARARHLALAHDQPNEAAASAISTGANRASERGAQDAAAELAAAALRLTPPGSGPLLSRRVMATAVHLARAGELRQARAVCEELLPAVPAGPQRAALLRLIGEVHLQEDSFPEGIELLERAAREAGSDLALRIPIDLQLTYAIVNRLRPRDAVQHARRAVTDARRLGQPRLLCTALAVNEVARFFVGLPFRQARIDEALRLESRTSGDPALFRPSLLAGMLYSATGRHREAIDLFRNVAADARSLGDEASLIPALMYVSWCALFSGDIELATGAAAEAKATADNVGGDVALAQALTATSRIALMRGDVALAEADASAADLAYRRAEWISGEIWPISVLGALRWALDDARGTVAILHDALWAHWSVGFGAAVTPTATDLLEAQIGLGLVADAEATIAHILRRLGASRPSRFERSVAARGRALLLVRAGRLTEALGQMDAAMEHLKAIDPLPYEEARTLLVRGRIERRMKRRAAARATFQAALERFEAIGARLWIERTEAEIARIGGRAADELSEAELRIATLAARGLTNRAVSELAFVTPKSVEGILDRVYTKLGIHSRAELGAWAASHPHDDRAAGKS